MVAYRLVLRICSADLQMLQGLTPVPTCSSVLGTVGYCTVLLGNVQLQLHTAVLQQTAAATQHISLLACLLGLLISKEYAAAALDPLSCELTILVLMAASQ